MKSSPSDLWTAALGKIQLHVTEQTYEAWFQPTKCVAHSSEGVRIQVPNQFFADWLRDNYLTLISSCLTEVLHEAPASVDFAISNQAARRPGASPSRGMPPRGSGGAPAAKERGAARPAGPGGGPTGQISRAKISMSQFNSRYLFDNFVVGRSNQFAHAASLAVAENPALVYNPLFVYGGVGLGKTHLLQAVGHKVIEKKPNSRIYYVSAESFMNEMIYSIQKGETLRFKEKYRTVDLLLIDDVHFLAGKESTQEEFFHTFNALYNSKKQIVMTSDRPPKDIPNLEERLVSRFEWGLVADIGSPDLETRIAILRKKAELEKLSIPNDVLLFIAKSIRSNIRQLEGSLVRLLAFSSLTGQDLNVDLAREVLKDFLSQRTNKATIRDILRVCSEHFEIPEEAILSKRRTADIALARQVAMYFARQMGGLSLSQIGARFGGRDHTTVLHACQKIEKMSVADEQFQGKLDRLADEITA